MNFLNFRRFQDQMVRQVPNKNKSNIVLSMELNGPIITNNITRTMEDVD